MNATCGFGCFSSDMGDVVSVSATALVLQQYADMVHELGGPTIHQKSTTRHVKGGDQLLKDEATDDEVVTTTHIRLKDDTKRIHPFEKQPCPEDEPLPLAEDGWEYVPTGVGLPEGSATTPGGYCLD